MDNNPAAWFTDYKTLLSSPNLGNESSNGDGNNNSINKRGISIAERRAAKCGFKMKAERINTARFRSTSPLTSPCATPVRSPFITIPPGISPTALLDSPIMLPNSHAQGNDFDFEATLLVDLSMDFQFPMELSKEATPEKCTTDSHTDVNSLYSMIGNANGSYMQICSSDLSSDPISVKRGIIHGENVESHCLMEEQKGTLPETAIGRTSEDGYNWRKYGQKQVKGSEYPRSYYKCTHANCLVKKKVERAYDGQITEIIYKGTHNHPKPQPSRGAPPGPASSLDEMPGMDEGENSVRVEGGLIQKNTESGSKDIRVHSDWRADGLERTSSTSVVTELSDPLSTAQIKSVETFESTETPELSSTLASHADDDGVTQGSSVGIDADDESESKRRKIESCLAETNIASRAVREPRVVVQIESEVDILDDGYRWRKYGQKVVKGNPNPRSYYKCTSAGCSVRKHVERASHNLKYVITTYEGKHNHEVPAARNSSHGNSSGSNLSQTSGNAQPALPLARNTNAPNPEAQIQEFATSFDRKPVFNNDYMRSNFPGSFSNEMNLGSSSFYPMKFPRIQNAMPYDSFGFNNHHLAANHSGSVPSLVPDFPRSLSPCLQTAANLSLARVDFSSDRKPAGQVQTSLLGQQFIRPKQEQKDDNLYGTSPSIVDTLNTSSSSLSIYHRLLGNFQS